MGSEGKEIGGQSPLHVMKPTQLGEWLVSLRDTGKMEESGRWGMMSSTLDIWSLGAWGRSLGPWGP